MHGDKVKELLSTSQLMVFLRERTDKYRLVVFYHSRCKHCKDFAKAFVGQSYNIPDDVIMADINSASQRCAQAFYDHKIPGTPTFIMFNKHGKEHSRHVGSILTSEKWNAALDELKLGNKNKKY